MWHSVVILTLSLLIASDKITERLFDRLRERGPFGCVRCTSFWVSFAYCPWLVRSGVVRAVQVGALATVLAFGVGVAESIAAALWSREQIERDVAGMALYRDEKLISWIDAQPS